MKINFLLVSLTVLALSPFIFVQPIYSQEKATKEECVAKVHEAVDMIAEIGLEPSLKKIMDKDGGYIWKDSYVFCVDDVGKTLAHPMTRLVGFPMLRFKDADGKEPFVEILEVAKKVGKGWKNYNYAGRGQTVPRMKNTYYVKVPGENVIVCAGYYE